jgi:plasmid stability protein
MSPSVLDRSHAGHYPNQQGNKNVMSLISKQSSQAHIYAPVATLLCMRTTIVLDDEVFRAYKQRAAERGTSLRHEIEEALRAELTARAEATMAQPYEVPVFRGRAPVPGVDLNSNAALAELLDRGA